MRLISFKQILTSVLFLVGSLALAQTTVTIGTGTSSSSTRGPFQRADTNSSTVYSRYVHIYTATELAAAGIVNGASISALNWELASSNIIVGTGNANLKIYVKNSSATSSVSDTWANHIMGSTLAMDTDYNTMNNFPGSNGWMPFNFSSPFTYTGGSLEIAVDWDCSQVSSPAFSGNGALKWRWASTGNDTLVVKKTSSSSPSSTISDRKNERANIQFVYNLVSCDLPTALNASTTSSTANFGWAASSSATSYNWKVVAQGAGSSATPIDFGNTLNTNDSAQGLSMLTSYDLFVEADCGTIGTSGFAGPFTFLTQATTLSTASIGAGTSSSSTRGPFQRSDTNSSTVYSRFIQVYTASELAAAGITTGSLITSLNWELASSNIIIGNGDANLKVYIKNSLASTSISDSWTNHIAGSSLVLDNNYNTTNNFPGANGWMPFNFNNAFAYTGGSLEVAVDWDCSQVSTPAFSGDGSLKWRWESTAPDTLVVKKTSSSSPSSTISDRKTDRANIQIVYSASVMVCDPPTALSALTTDTTAIVSWIASPTAVSYTWRLVPAGAGVGAMAVDSGITLNVSDTAWNLLPLSSYDLYVESDCGASGASGFVGPYNLLTTGPAQTLATIGTGTSSSSTRGPFQRSDTASSTVFSRFVHVYTAAELAAAGLANGANISSINWELASSNQIIGTGDANLKIYIKNSNASSASADTWANLTAGSNLVADNNYNTSNNFPGANGWMPFNFNAPFNYTGGAIEVAVDWDCSQVSTPAFSGDGSLKWRWTTTAPDSLVVKKTSSSAPSSNISDLKDERANIQFVFSGGAPLPCDPPTGFTSTVTDSSANLNWVASSSATSYIWKVVNAGAGVSSPALDSGTTGATMVLAESLLANTSYDLFVESICGTTGTSIIAGPYMFTTSDDVGLISNEILREFSISPNPTNGIANIDLDLTIDSEVELTLYSIRGELVKNIYHDNASQLKMAIDVSDFKDGLYFVRLTINGQSILKKIIISK